MKVLRKSHTIDGISKLPLARNNKLRQQKKALNKLLGKQILSKEELQKMQQLKEITGSIDVTIPDQKTKGVPKFYPNVLSPDYKPLFTVEVPAEDVEAAVKATNEHGLESARRFQTKPDNVIVSYRSFDVIPIYDTTIVKDELIQTNTFLIISPVFSCYFLYQITKAFDVNNYAKLEELMCKVIDTYILTHLTTQEDFDIVKSELTPSTDEVTIATPGLFETDSINPLPNSQSVYQLEINKI